MENKYNVGDVVKVKSVADCNEIEDFIGGFEDNMEKYCESEVTITKIVTTVYDDTMYYEFENSEHIWDERAFEPVHQSERDKLRKEIAEKQRKLSKLDEIHKFVDGNTPADLLILKNLVDEKLRSAK